VILVDSDILEYFKRRAGKEGLQGLINEALRASMVKA